MNLRFEPDVDKSDSESDKASTGAKREGCLAKILLGLAQPLLCAECFDSFMAKIQLVIYILCYIAETHMMIR